MHEQKEMNANVKNLFDLFKMAIEAERNAQQMYKEALQYCEKPIMKGVLQKLYEEETRHEKVLIKYYNQLRKEYDIEGKPL